MSAKSIIFVLAVNIVFDTSDCKLVHERVELIETNEKYVNNIKVKMNKGNQGAASFDIDFCPKVDFGGDSLKLIVTPQIFRKGEYKKSPLKLDFKICDMMKKNALGIANLISAGYITYCPLKKGCYKVKNFTIRSEDLPSMIPPGRYLADLTFMFQKERVATARWYGSL